MASHVSRTLELFRERGWLACVVEKYNSFIKQKFDVFGFADILACHEGPPPWIMLAQVCGEDVSSHFDKMRSEPRVREWLRCGGCIFIYGWRKNAKNRWTVREIEVVLDDTQTKIEFLEVE